MESGYNYCILDGYTFPQNPYPYHNYVEKPAADVKTLTKTVQMGWDIDNSDRIIRMEIPNATKAMRDALKTKHEASDTPTYTFKDPYGVSWSVTFRSFDDPQAGTTEYFNLRITLRVLAKL